MFKYLSGSNLMAKKFFGSILIKEEMKFKVFLVSYYSKRFITKRTKFSFKWN